MPVAGKQNRATLKGVKELPKLVGLWHVYAISPAGVVEPKFVPILLFVIPTLMWGGYHVEGECNGDEEVIDERSSKHSKIPYLQNIIIAA